MKQRVFRLLVVAAVLALGVAALGVSPAVGQSTAAPRLPRVVYEFQRTTRGPAILRWTAGANAGFGQLQLVGAVLTHNKDGRIVDTEFPFVVAQRNVDGGVEFYADGRRVDCSTTGDRKRFCEEGFQSTSAGLTQFERVDEGGRGQAWGMFVVVQGGDQFMELDDSSRGWRLRRHTDVTARVVKAQDGDAVGVDGPSGATDAEVFFSAAGRGSSGGSVAVGQPPCGGPEGSPVSTGAGTVQLLGGKEKPRLTCPVDTGGHALADFNRRATKWRLEGLAAGNPVFVSTVRLVIFNFPPLQPAANPKQLDNLKEPASPSAAGGDAHDNAPVGRSASAASAGGVSPTGSGAAAPQQSLPATGGAALLPLAGAGMAALSLRLRVTSRRR